MRLYFWTMRALRVPDWPKRPRIVRRVAYWLLYGQTLFDSERCQTCGRKTNGEVYVINWGWCIRLSYAKSGLFIIGRMLTAPRTALRIETETYRALSAVSHAAITAAVQRIRTSTSFATASTLSSDRVASACRTSGSSREEETNMRRIDSA